MIIWECNHLHLKGWTIKRTLFFWYFWVLLKWNTTDANPAKRTFPKRLMEPNKVCKRFYKVRRHLVHLANYLGPPSTCTSDQRGHDLSPHLGQKAWTPSRRLSSWWRTGKTCRSAAPEETATAGWGRCLQNRWERRCAFFFLKQAVYTEKTYCCWCRHWLACGFNLKSVSSGRRYQDPDSMDH